jgi:hypothetical protein
MVWPCLTWKHLGREVAVDERERQEMLEGLEALRLTPEYQALRDGRASELDVATLRKVLQHFRWRAAERPGEFTPGQIQADVERVEHERRAFTEGYIPQWLAAELPPTLVYAETGESSGTKFEGGPAPRDPDMRPDIEEP